MNVFRTRRVRIVNSERSTRKRRMENHSPSLTVEAARLLVAIIRNSIQKSKGRRWNFEDSLGSVSP
jgi:hypothetical protein